MSRIVVQLVKVTGGAGRRGEEEPHPPWTTRAQGLHFTAALAAAGFRLNYTKKLATGEECGPRRWGEPSSLGYVQRSSQLRPGQLVLKNNQEFLKCVCLCLSRVSRVIMNDYG